MRWDLRIAAPKDFQYQSLHGISIKCVPQSHHLIQDTSQGPNIRFLVVGLLLTYLWRQIIRCSNCGLSAIIGMLEHSGNSKVTDLNGAILVHENILSLQVSVEDLSIVNMLNGEGHLNEPVQYLVLAIANLAYLLLISYLSVEVSAVGVVHDNTQTAFIHK